MSQKNAEKLISIFIPLLIFAFYQDLLRFDFINLDDPGYVFENPFVKNGLSWESVKWAFTTNAMGHWHPLTWLSHMTDVSLFGLSSGAMHGVNLMFHAFNSLFVFMLMRRLSVALYIALFGALFFALHPMRLESVAWISERKDVLSLFFGLSSVLLYFNFSLKNKSKLIWSVGVSLLFTLSLLAKPTMVSVPILLILLESKIDPTRSLKNRILSKANLFFISAFFCLAVLNAQSQVGALKDINMFTRLEAGIVSLGAYLGKFFLPFDQTIFYPSQTYLSGVVSAIFVGLVSTSYVLYSLRKFEPMIWLGWLWFLVSALPTAGIIQVGGQAFADRWTMLPHIGLLLGASLSITKIKTELQPRLMYTIASTALIVMAFASQTQIPNWRNSESIFSHALEIDSNNFMAHTNLGSHFDRIGRLDLAAPHYEEALRLRPEYAEALNNLGSLKARKGNIAEAISLFEKAIARDPTLSAARHNLGLAYQSKKSFHSALEQSVQLKDVNNLAQCAKPPDQSSRR